MPMKCHYEVLGVGRDADDDDIKKSYRKLALKFHPDKNPDCVEEVKAAFLEVQQAYEVLSDPQERAWYDKHREAILRGGCGRNDYQDDAIDVFQFFNSSCFKGFGDDENGFYFVYRRMFAQINDEDLPFREDDADENGDVRNYYTFGDSQSDWDEVVAPFYAFWESYCTAKSFVWVEKWDTREAPNRRVRRAMEEENKKLRDASRRARNEEIRNIVRFVKKRDRRVQAHKKIVEERNEAAARKSAQHAERIRLERLEAMESYSEPDWMKTAGVEEALRQIEADLDGRIAETAALDEDDALYCVACDKLFRTDKAFANHEKSKKHRENVEILKEVMMRDEEEAQAKQTCENHKAEASNFAKNGELEEETIMESNLDGDSELDVEEKTTSNATVHKVKTSFDDTPPPSTDSTSNGLNENSAIDDADDDADDMLRRLVRQQQEQSRSGKKGKKKSRRKKEEAEQDDISVELEGGDKESENEKVNENRKLNERRENEDPEYFILGAEEPQREKEIKHTGENSAEAKSGSCLICGAIFPSRTKLFEHIKKEGHAQLKTEAPPKPGKKKGKR